MKPLKLEFCGINSFSERAEIDFERLAEYGIFGIFGDTGSGKSTILDCISFALYGDVARSKGSLSEIINYKMDKAFVNFEFRIRYGGKMRTYRVEREIKRKNAAQSVRLYERTGESDAAISEGVRETNAALLRIVGLEQKDFEKCIALPQGEFSQFVKAVRSERLKLVSRLFDLERYGEGLVKRANAKYAALREEVSVAAARLDPYTELTAHTIGTMRQEIADLEKQEGESEKTLNVLREREHALAGLVENAARYLRVAAEYEKLEAQKAAMSELNSELLRLEKAGAVCRNARELEAVKQKRKQADEAYALAARRLALAREAAEKISAFDAESLDRQIESLNAKLAESKGAELARKECRTAEERLKALQEEHAAELASFRDFSYEESRAKIEETLRVLGSDEDFLSYAETHGKAALLSGEYRVFANELTELTERHAEIAPDTQPLISKYSALSAGDTTDMQILRTGFERRKRERTEAQNALLMLEKQKSRYDIHLNKLQNLETERQQLKARIAECRSVFEGLAPLEPLQKELDALKERKRRYESELRAVGEESAKSEAAVSAAKAACEVHAQSFESADARLRESLAEGGFQSEAEARALTEKFGDPAAARSRVENYRERYAETRARLRELGKEDYSEATEENLKTARAQLRERETFFREISRTLAVRRAALEKAQSDLAKKNELEREYAQKKAQAEVYERLKKLLDANKFMEYVAEEYLVSVAQDASKRLLSLTGGRYCLRYDGGFAVGDNFDGGNTRSVSTLSGGETFLVSLSLALSLGAQVCAKSLRPIEFFFLDEGFGTLDEKLVDTVMDSLERLKGEHFTIGLISHVEELKHRIDKKLVVIKATEQSGSKIIAE